MGVIEYFVIVVIIGVIVWIIHAFTPIDAKFKKIVLWAGVIVCVVILCHALGLFGRDVAIPKIK